MSRKRRAPASLTDLHEPACSERLRRFLEGGDCSEQAIEALLGIKRRGVVRRAQERAGPASKPDGQPPPEGDEGPSFST